MLTVILDKELLKHGTASKMLTSAFGCCESRVSKHLINFARQTLSRVFRKLSVTLTVIPDYLSMIMKYYLCRYVLSRLRVNRYNLCTISKTHK